MLHNRLTNNDGITQESLLAQCTVLQSMHVLCCNVKGWRVQAMLKEMEVVRKRVLEKPGVLPELVKQLRLGNTEQQSQAAEMLFCVVGQGPGRDAAAIRQVGPPVSATHAACLHFRDA